MNTVTLDQLETARALMRTISPATVHSLADRRAVLGRLRDSLIKNTSALCRAVSRDIGRPSLDTRLTEIFPLVSAIDHAVRHLEKWAARVSVSATLDTFPAIAEHRAEPLGRVYVMSPWNFPILLALEPAIDAIAAGNAVIVRPSNTTVATLAAIETVVADAELGAALRIHACGHCESDAIVLSGLVDHVFYTGSAGVGRHVARLAAETLTPITLELGGKSPVIVASDADLLLTAERLVWGRLTNAGQICIAPDYILCEESVAERLCSNLTDLIITRLGAGAPEAVTLPQYKDHPNWRPRIVSEHNAARLGKWLCQATEPVCDKPAPAQIYVGGPTGVDAEARIVLPTVLLFRDMEAFTSTDIGREEIFGPILPVVPVPNVEAALEFINARPKPLALYAFTRDLKLAHNIADSTRSGSFCHNDVLMFMTNPNLPFGGVGASGTGRYHGKWGFDHLSHIKTRMFRPHAGPAALDPRLTRHASCPGRMARAAFAYLGIDRNAAIEDDKAIWGSPEQPAEEPAEEPAAEASPAEPEAEVKPTEPEPEPEEPAMVPEVEEGEA